MRRLVYSLAIAVSLSSASCARAVNDTAPLATQDVTSALRSADNRNWYLQIVRDTSTAQGTITSLTAEQVRIGGQRIEVADIDLIRRRQTTGGGGRSGMITGGIIGGGTYGLFAGIGGPALMVAGAILGTVIGGVIGGIAGSLIRSGEESWEVVWQR
jgi:hypothetical protein